ncbi:MAG: hypothetical protein K2X93_23500 [Candidatus Obscuribacterales bacterium]|nr:hypothetical protein [Candidatus Obscuribacterales bacterium]
MAKNTSTVVEVDDAAHDNGLIGEDITESIVQWIRTLKKEGVSPDTAAQVYVGVLQTAIAAQCDSDYIMDAYDEFDDEDEDEDE